MRDIALCKTGSAEPSNPLLIATADFANMPPLLSARHRLTTWHPRGELAMTSCAPSRLRSFHTTAWTLLGAFLFVLLVPWLFRRGMFWDGVVYGAISRNLAAGIGDAWHPMVTSTFLRHFREQPPLGFWLQAAFFRVLRRSLLDRARL